MKKDYINNIEGAERRFINPEMEIREEGDKKHILGVAAVVERETDLGWFREKIARGAFDDVLNQDTVALFNHDSNLPLARTTANKEAKLHLFIDENGHLAYSYPPPKTSIGADLTENIRNKVVKHSSFAFTIGEEKWEFASKENGLDKDVRTILKIDRLYDVSPVTYPAYLDTTVAARSKEHFEKSNNNSQIVQMRHRLIKIKNKIKIG